MATGPPARAGTGTGMTLASCCSTRHPARSRRPALGTAGGVHRRSLVNTAMNLDQGDTNPCTPREDTIIYELHVRGFTSTLRRRPAPRAPSPA